MAVLSQKVSQLLGPLGLAYQSANPEMGRLMAVATLAYGSMLFSCQLLVYSRDKGLPVEVRTTESP